jgi:PAS domain S-box-containing protein
MAGGVDFRRVFEGALEPQLLLGRDAVVVAVTDAYLRAAGTTRQEVIGRTLFEVPPYTRLERDAAAGLADELSRVWRSGVHLPHRIVGGYRSAAISVPVLEASGAVLQVVHTLGQAGDVPERVALEDALRQRNEELQIALEAAHAIGWHVNLSEPNIIRFSGDPTAFYGYALEPGEQFDLEHTVHPEDQRGVREQANRALQQGEDLSSEFRGLPGTGQQRHYASRGRMLRDASGRPSRVVGVTWDVTERARLTAESAQLQRRMLEAQKLESLGVLAGGIAHDFNNILTAVLGNASLARIVLDQTSPALDPIGQIEEASRRATDLCRQMLAYAGKGRFVLQRTNLNELIESTTHLLQVSISKKAVLRLHLDRGLPAIVADNTQIRQVLMNLVINASDAIGDRSGVISISTGVVRADRDYLDKTVRAPDIPTGDYVFVEVSDTGSGMTPEIQARIFEPFFTSKFTGRGLGLAAVSGIVQGHKGALKVYSEPGKGSSFKLLLPAATQDGAPLDGRAEGEVTLVPRGTILIVDDEETVQAVAARMLEALGFGVLLASDGRRALTVYAEKRDIITAVLMDLTMPHLDGEETFRELRRVDPHVRVLLMSGYNEQDAVARFVGKGLAGFIQKPFNIGDLKESLRLLFG